MTRTRPPWTLRRRLLLGIIGLLAVVSVVIGAVSVLSLRASLIANVDQKLSEATSRIGQFGGGAQAGLAPGTIEWQSLGGSINGFILGQGIDESPNGQPLLTATDLTTAQLADVARTRMDGTPTTSNIVGAGTYRLKAVTSPRFGTVVIGLPLTEVTSTVGLLALVVGGVTILGLILAFFVGTAIVRIALRPLDRVTATASAVAELPLERGEVALEARVPDEDADPRTEVGRVGSAINRMLGHISNALSARESSERKLRSFVADASHELRTPLASIRGYAELTRRGGHDLPPDVVHAIGRVESESVRMTSLVEDLLLLARLDDGRELESRPVDLTHMLADAVSDAHAAGQDHDWVLDVPEEPVVAPGDAARLHQVVANLLANARVHTPAGTRVTASVVRLADAVEISITDDGPGIDEKTLPTVFERFARGDSSRSRASGSTGLGLAIVAAVVAAHAGTVAVESEPGRTRFSVTLPATS